MKEYNFKREWLLITLYQAFPYIQDFDFRDDNLIITNSDYTKNIVKKSDLVSFLERKYFNGYKIDSISYDDNLETVNIITSERENIKKDGLVYVSPRELKTIIAKYYDIKNSDVIFKKRGYKDTNIFVKFKNDLIPVNKKMLLDICSSYFNNDTVTVEDVICELDKPNVFKVLVSKKITNDTDINMKEFNFDENVMNLYNLSKDYVKVHKQKLWESFIIGMLNSNRKFADNVAIINGVVYFSELLNNVDSYDNIIECIENNDIYGKYINSIVYILGEYFINGSELLIAYKDRLNKSNKELYL